MAYETHPHKLRKNELKDHMTMIQKFAFQLKNPYIPCRYE